MRAGTLTDQVSLQEPGTVQDEIGQPVPGWTEVASLWANVRYLSGIEAIRSDSPASIAKVSIQIRKRDGVTAAMRMVDAQGVVFKIETVLPDMQHRDRINIVCEVVSG
jgi:SPP1 family predicted phage head-tail adaptor